MKKSSKIFVGMDVHKESIDITLAEPAGEVRRWGQIGGDRVALAKAVRKLESLGGEQRFIFHQTVDLSIPTQHRRCRTPHSTSGQRRNAMRLR